MTQSDISPLPQPSSVTPSAKVVVTSPTKVSYETSTSEVVVVSPVQKNLHYFEVGDLVSFTQEMNTPTLSGELSIPEGEIGEKETVKNLFVYTKIR